VITPVAPGFHSRIIDFGDGPRLAVTIPWGDVSTAYHSTGIPNVRVYMSVHPKQLRALRMSRYIGWLLRTPFMQSKLRARVMSGKAGPSDEQRAKGASMLWGEIRNARGDVKVSRIHAPQGYTLTADTAVRCAMRVLDGNYRAGFQTPSRAWGADFILEADGVVRTDD
jgi:short subunit dehydrogenase-like uncharacterized protein